MLRGSMLAVALAIFVTLAMTTSAQSFRLSASIPFEFTVNGHTLPAGQYLLNKHPDFPNGWVIADVKHHSNSVLVALPAQAKQEGEQPRLVFHRYGSHYFLCELWTSTSDHVLAFKESREERQLVQAIGRPDIQAVAMR